MGQKMRNHVRRQVSFVLLTLLCLLSFAACGKKGADKTTTPSPAGETVTTATLSPTPEVAFFKKAYETAGRADLYRLPIITPDVNTSAFCIQTAGEYAIFSITEIQQPEGETGETRSHCLFALCRPLVTKQIKYFDPGFSVGVTALFEDGSFLLEDWENGRVCLYDNKMDEVRAYGYDPSLFLGEYLGEADGCWYFFAMNEARNPMYVGLPKEGGDSVIVAEPVEIDASTAPVKYPQGWRSMSDSSLSATWFLHETANEENGIAFTKSREKEWYECISGTLMCGRGEYKTEDGETANEFRMYDLSNGTIFGKLSELDLAERYTLRAERILQNKAVIMNALKKDGSSEVMMWVPEEEPVKIAGLCDFTKNEPIDCLAEMVKDLKENSDVLITPDILEQRDEEVAFAEVMYEINFANQFVLARATRPELLPAGTVHPENMRNNGTGHYEFNPHVFSKIYTLEHGEARKEAFFNFVDALRAGEEWFDCPDEDTMWWCRGRLGHFFYPVEEWYTFCGVYKNGKGQIIRYDGTTQEQFDEKKAEFERMITDIVNDAVGDDYNDIEKTLALYEFLTEYCTYDYEMLEHMSDWSDRQGGYRALIEKKGVCNEYACLYQYLLLQCGVDAEESGGPSVTEGMDSHAWVYVTIDGKGYLVDPTWGATDSREPKLEYFLFTDELRETRDGFRASAFDIAGCGSESRKKYSFEANDKRFEGLWDGTYVAMDRASKNIYFLDEDGRLKAFYYGK